MNTRTSNVKGYQRHLMPYTCTSVRQVKYVFIAVQKRKDESSFIALYKIIFLVAINRERPQNTTHMLQPSGRNKLCDNKTPQTLLNMENCFLEKQPHQSHILYPHQQRDGSVELEDLLSPKRQVGRLQSKSQMIKYPA